MVVPVIVVVVAIAAILGGAALKWDDLIVKLKGKRLAVLGDRGVGKTHLIKFLSTGSIPSEYKQGVGPESVPARRFKLKELDIEIKETWDVSGEKAAYSDWKDVYADADLVFYLLRADRLIERDSAVETRVKADMRHIGEWIEKRKKPPRFFIIGTHCDLDPQYSKLTSDIIGSYVDRFTELSVVKEVVMRAGGTKNVKLILGDMKTKKTTEELVYKIFQQVVS